MVHIILQDADQVRPEQFVDMGETIGDSEWSEIGE